MTVDDLAKKLCEAAGQEPDRLVYAWKPEQINTPDGIVHAYHFEPTPLWHRWFGTAERLVEMGVFKVADKDRS